MRRDNNFDILRLALAWIVVLWHCEVLYRLGSFRPLHPILRFNAVEGFFAISGCLIVASWDRSRSAQEYFSRRARRILPAYWFSLLVCLGVGSVMTTLPLRAFWTNPGTYQYLVSNLLFLNFLHLDLPGTFAANPYAAMNGALWTIKVEVAFYVFVPLLAWCVRKVGKVPALVGFFAASLLYRSVMSHLTVGEKLSQQLPGQLVFFLGGAAVYYFYPQFIAHKKKMWIAAVVLMGAVFFAHASFLDVIATPLFILCVAFLLPPFRGLTRFGDFSYGTYVLHYPIVQMFVALGLFARSPWLALGGVVLAVSCLSVFSWFAVERNFLQPARVRQQESETKAIAV